MTAFIGRREFMTLLGGAAVAWPVAARAQQAAMPVIGWLSSETRGAGELPRRPFRQGLNEAGYIKGQNVAVEYRFAGGEYERLPALAADLVRRQVVIARAASLQHLLQMLGHITTRSRRSLMMK